MHIDANGHLIVPYLERPDSTSSRNTLHWCINGIVTDHAYGKFNKDSDGNLTGDVVIIAHPEDMPTPAGFSQVDTWFRLSTIVNTDGLLQRQLDVRKATVVMPKGFDVPPGIQAVFYDGTIEDRDAVVAKLLADKNIKQHHIGMWSWKERTTDGTSW